MMDSLLAMTGLAFIYLNFVFILAGIALYLLQAVGLYGMGKNAEVKHNWLAFLPVINAYVWGKIIKEIKISKYVLPYPEIVLPVAPFIYALLYDLSILGPLLLLCLFVLYAAGFYRLYSLYRPDSVAIYTIISIVFPFVVPFFFFSLRKESPLSTEEKKRNLDSAPELKGKK